MTAIFKWALGTSQRKEWFQLKNNLAQRRKGY